MGRVLLVALVLSGALAHAEEDFDVVAARRHFVKAKAQLAKGSYESALHEFQVARTIKPLPDLDYDVARCLDALERYPEAISEYQRYLTHSPADATAVQARIAVLHDRMGAIERYDGGKAPPAAKTQPKAAEKPPEKTAEKPPEKTAPEKIVEKPPEKAPENAGAENLPPAPELAAEPLTRPLQKPPIYRRWWLWTAVGGAAVVLALGVGLGVGLSASNQPAFQPSLMSFGPGAR